jgi:dTDP-4-amino-4,6-dideoxygalactose transaminase
MVDLLNQYKKIKPEIDNAINNVLESTKFINGDEVQLFEKELAQYLNVKHVITCGNGTDALQLALMALNLSPGDEVITADFTFVATAEVIALLGLKPVFVDVDENTFTIIPELIEKAITEKTKVIIPVHLFGQTAGMGKIMAIAKKHNLHVIEDAAQALGSDYLTGKNEILKAGTIGDIGTTSFFPSKNLGCFGDGGALFTNNDDLAKKIRMISNHGSEKKYHNDIIGINSRLDTIQAAILRTKLNYLDKYNTERQKAAKFYNDNLSGIKDLKIPQQSINSSHIYHQYTLKINKGLRDKLKEFLQENGVPSMIYYPIPLHTQKAYSDSQFVIENLHNSINCSNSVLSLPMHTELTEIELTKIVELIQLFFQQN